jgi:hypothetical protein
VDDDGGPGNILYCLRITGYLTLPFRKVFGRDHRKDLTPDVVSKMSVTALANQRMVLENATFDSD